MLVYSTFLISLDGRPMVHATFQREDTVPNVVLLAGMLASIQYLSEELSGVRGAAEQFTMRGITYHMKTFEQFIVVVVTNSRYDFTNLASDIGWSFLSQFGEQIDQWDSTEEYFLPFVASIQRIVKKSGYVDITRSVDPTKRLDTVTIFDLPPSLQQAAMALVTLVKASLEEISEYLEIDEDLITGTLNFLQSEGYVGIIEEKDGQLKYYVITD